jgi:hypothetical protein
MRRQMLYLCNQGVNIQFVDRQGPVKAVDFKQVSYPGHNSQKTFISLSGLLTRS